MGNRIGRLELPNWVKIQAYHDIKNHWYLLRLNGQNITCDPINKLRYLNTADFINNTENRSEIWIWLEDAIQNFLNLNDMCIKLFNDRTKLLSIRKVGNGALNQNSGIELNVDQTVLNISAYFDQSHGIQPDKSLIKKLLNQPRVKCALADKLHDRRRTLLFATLLFNKTY